MTRRELLAAAALPLAAGRLAALKMHMTRANISAITDEIALTQEDAIAFAHQYGLQWVELRNVPETGQEFAKLSEPELHRWAAQLNAEKLKVSFLNTSLLKFAWSEGGQRWDRRMSDFRNAVKAAHILGADKLRIFTGSRVANPASALPLIVRTLEELIPIAEQGKVHLAIENDPSQNIGTAAETKAILELLPSPSIGLNWDAHNGLELGEAPWPDGYAAVPKARLFNVQVNGKGVLDGSAEHLDWKSILKALERDGYRGQVGLKTHTPGPELVSNAHLAMKNLLRIVGDLS